VSQPFGSVAKDSGQVQVASGQVIPFPHVLADAGGFWDAVNHQFVIPVGAGGVYLVGMWCQAIGTDGDLAPATGAVNTSGAAINVAYGMAAYYDVHGYSAAASSQMLCADGDALTATVVWGGAATSAQVQGTFWFARLGDA
jgi:hypothetical protein